MAILSQFHPLSDHSAFNPIFFSSPLRGERKVLSFFCLPRSFFDNVLRHSSPPSIALDLIFPPFPSSIFHLFFLTLYSPHSSYPLYHYPPSLTYPYFFPIPSSPHLHSILFFLPSYLPNPSPSFFLSFSRIIFFLTPPLLSSFPQSHSLLSSLLSFPP